MPPRSTRILIENNTDFALTYVDYHFCHGQWTDGWDPKTIPARTQGGFRGESASPSIATGTEGWVKYRLENTDEPDASGNPVKSFVYIYWDNPYIRNPDYNPMPTVGVDINDYTPGCDHNSIISTKNSKYELSLGNWDKGDTLDNHDVWGVIAAFGALGPQAVLGWLTTLDNFFHGDFDNVEFDFFLHDPPSLAQFLPLRYDRSRGIRPFFEAAKTTSLRKIMGL